MNPSTGYLILRTSAEDLRTSLQIQTQTVSRMSRSSAEGFRYSAGYLKLRFREDIVISHGRNWFCSD